MSNISLSTVSQNERIPYKIVPMTRELVPAVASIEKECFSSPWSEAMLEEELDNLCASYLVAVTVRGEVLGYAGIQIPADEGYITNIAVREPYRKQGVAGELLGVFLRFAEANHLAFVTLEVRVSNTPAIQLYLKHGFAQVGRRKNYYENPREDAIIMTREFGPSKDAEVTIEDAPSAGT